MAVPDPRDVATRLADWQPVDTADIPHLLATVWRVTQARRDTPDEARD